MNRWPFVAVAGVMLMVSACGESEPEQNQQPTAADVAPVTPASPASAPSGVAAVPITETTLASAEPLPGHCYLDKVESGTSEPGGFAADAGESIRLVGWAVNSDKAAPTHMSFVLQGEQSYALPGSIGGVRPDVAKALQSEAASESGVGVRTTLSGVAPGKYQVMALVGAPDQPQTLCDMSRYLQVNG